jgi:hypothetical protein
MREMTVLTPFLMEFLKLFQELKSLSFRDLLCACENVDDVQGSGATAPVRINGEEEQSGDGGNGDGEGRIRLLTGDDQGT